jgi:hypothetical protein
VQPEDVLRLINSAPQRYDTVRATLRYRDDGATMRTLRDRHRASEAYRLETGGSPDPSEGGRVPRARRSLRLALPGVVRQGEPRAW